MKKLCIVTLLFVVAITVSTAQQRRMPSAEERAKNQTERLNKLVGLTEDQKPKVQAVNLHFSKQMDEQMRSNRGNREALRTKMQEINDDRDAGYKEILTEDQFKKYAEAKARREKEIEERRAERSNR